MARTPSHSSGRVLTKHVSLAPVHQDLLTTLRCRWRMESESATIRRALEECGYLVSTHPKKTNEQAKIHRRARASG